MKEYRNENEDEKITTSTGSGKEIGGKKIRHIQTWNREREKERDRGKGRKKGIPPPLVPNKTFNIASLHFWCCVCLLSCLVRA